MRGILKWLVVFSVLLNEAHSADWTSFLKPLQNRCGVLLDEYGSAPVLNMIASRRIPVYLQSDILFYPSESYDGIYLLKNATAFGFPLSAILVDTSDVGIEVSLKFKYMYADYLLPKFYYETENVRAVSGTKQAFLKREGRAIQPIPYPPSQIDNDGYFLVKWQEYEKLDDFSAIVVSVPDGWFFSDSELNFQSLKINAKNNTIKCFYHSD